MMMMMMTKVMMKTARGKLRIPRWHREWKIKFIVDVDDGDDDDDDDDEDDDGDDDDALRDIDLFEESEDRPQF